MDIPFDLEAFRYQGPSNERCYALFAKLGFRSLVTEFAPTASSIEKNYAVVASLDELRDVARSLEEAGRFALRVVADGPSCVRAQLVGLVFSTAPRHARYVPLGREGFAGGSSRSQGRTRHSPPCPRKRLDRESRP